MKIRAGFVSNSSSSSFIIYNDKFYKDLNFLGYEFRLKEEGEVEIEIVIVIDDKFNGYTFDVLKTIEEKIEYLLKCIINKPGLVLDEEDYNEYIRLHNEYYDLINNYDKGKINDLQEEIEVLEWKAIDIFLNKVKSLVKEIKEISIVRVKDTYIDFDSIPEKDFFENDKKLKEFLYSGTVYFGNDNTNKLEIPVVHYISYNENKDTDNIYYLENSRHLIYDFDEITGFEDKGSKYFECFEKCVGKIND